MKLFKTTIIIWSEYDPTGIQEIDSLAREAIQGDAYCSFQETIETDPEADANPPDLEFFNLLDNSGICILTNAEGENPDDCTTHAHEK